jgi:hypothetical protein
MSGNRSCPVSCVALRIVLVSLRQCYQPPVRRSKQSQAFSVVIAACHHSRRHKPCYCQKRLKSLRVITVVVTSPVIARRGSSLWIQNCLHYILGRTCSQKVTEFATVASYQKPSYHFKF